ncbi:dynein light chain Tctex-type 4 [Musca vetustissima]|uniref:dynein light chain Tctex-type 4 n=1 Tax=Musca vetustissima TaxID=27455 RepID=UPI002AB69A09|nr:dynein light chain Tctex-type 4 [Musca vetustissima]
MSSWSNMKSRITASVRTTNRMNALLSESMLGRRKALTKMATVDGDNETEEANAKPPRDWEFFRTNFSMEEVYKLIESSIEERLTWDRFSRSYDSWRSLQLAESLASDIRDRVRAFNHKRHRIVCILSVIEKQNQGIHMSMRHLMDEKMDNFTKLVYERPSYFIVVVVYLVYKD